MMPGRSFIIWCVGNNDNEAMKLLSLELRSNAFRLCLHRVLIALLLPHALLTEEYPIWLCAAHQLEFWHVSSASFQ